MTFGVIDTSPEICNYLEEQLVSLGSFNYVSVCSSHSLYQVAEYASKGKHDALLINIESSYEGKKRSDFYGIELIFWLRLRYDYTKPIYTYGFLSITQILKIKPEYIVLLAPRNFHLQLPLNFIQAARYLEFPQQEIESKELKKQYYSFVKPSININDFRHSLANLWGMTCLWDAHNSVKGTKTPYPNQLNQIDYQLKFLKAKSLFSLNERNLDEEIIIQKKIQDRTIAYSFKSENIKNETSEITTNHVKSINSAFRVFVIDDCFYSGWQEVYNFIFEGKITVKGSDLKDVEGLYLNGKFDLNLVHQWISESINDFDPNLVFLDLRLFNEKNSTEKIENLSGYKLLKILRPKFEKIPILITTASNKISSYKSLINYGADAYWVKEGIDEKKKSIDTLTNYFSLIDYVDKFNSTKYSYLSKLIEIKDACTDKSWWCNPTWINGDKTSCLVDDIKSILELIIVSYRSYLHNFYINEIKNNSYQIFHLTSLVAKMGNIVEIIHGINTEKSFKSGTNLVFDRIDTIGSKIRDNRNNSSHAGADSLKLDVFYDTIILMERYLLTGNNFTIKEIKKPITEIVDNNATVRFNCEDIRYTIYKIFNGSPEEVKLQKSSFLKEFKKDSFQVNVNEFNYGVLLYEVQELNLYISDELINLNPSDGISLGNLFWDRTNNKVFRLTKKAMSNFIQNGLSRNFIYSKGTKNWSIAEGSISIERSSVVREISKPISELVHDEFTVKFNFKKEMYTIRKIFTGNVEEIQKQKVSFMKELEKETFRVKVDGFNCGTLLYQIHELNLYTSNKIINLHPSDGYRIEKTLFWDRKNNRVLRLTKKAMSNFIQNGLNRKFEYSAGTKNWSISDVK